MIALVDINEQNWQKIAALSVTEEQKAFLDRPIGIVARGYAYRSSRAKVIGIANKEQLVGVALVKDMDEEPACYDLQQFMIDQHSQNKGYGTEALRQILTQLSQERKYDCVEVCVNKKDAAALHMYEKIGFINTGYIDERVPDCLNLMYNFPQQHEAFTDVLLSEFTSSQFQAAFRQYFDELGITVKNWAELFQEMNDDTGNLAYLRTDQNGGVIGFLQFKPILFTSWFFEETCGFIREFWIAPAYRNQYHGSSLLHLAEQYFVQNNIRTSILTTNTASRFYEKNGYIIAPGCKAKNRDSVYLKHL